MVGAAWRLVGAAWRLVGAAWRLVRAAWRLVRAAWHLKVPRVHGRIRVGDVGAIGVVDARATLFRAILEAVLLQLLVQDGLGKKGE